MILYSRKDCPLCEDLENSLNRLSIAYEYVDIDEKPELLKRYHCRVPVLVNNQQHELTWPFNEQDLLEFSLK